MAVTDPGQRPVYPPADKLEYAMRMNSEAWQAVNAALDAMDAQIRLFWRAMREAKRAMEAMSVARVELVAVQSGLHVAYLEHCDELARVIAADTRPRG